MTKGTKIKPTKTAKTAAKAPAKKAAAKPAVKKAVKAPAKAAAKTAPKATAKAAPKTAAKTPVTKGPATKTVAAKPAAKSTAPTKAAPAKVVPAKAAAAPVSVPRTKVIPTNATILPPDYDPKKDKGGFMNPVMLEYFRQKLIRWREELIRESTDTIHETLQNTELQKPDLADRASAETDHALELRTRDRERKLIGKINEALLRIEDGSYGYCEETGEPITVARLDARPNATLTIEAQERHERLEKTHRDE
ncbi:MAG: C4-type zinc finger protein DksA/TraR family [Micavibrio sp.]|nr:C4-type zinc finger protein DksA/TraR family [Micavibrio sp.]